MFDNLTDRLNRTIRNLRGIGRLTEANMEETLSQIRIALLEADVALGVVKEFVNNIKTKALGQDVMKSLTPGQALIKVVNDELISILGETTAELDLTAPAPVIVLMAGLQGSGKTTSVAKLARQLKEQKKKKVMVVSTDVYRPAAIEQLRVLAEEIDVQFFPSHADEKPIDIAHKALQQAKTQYVDVILIDTAGRLHIDDTMMTEIKSLHQNLQPTETLFVVDSMTGQDAANTAKAFHEALPLTGVILTKVDGDARGGAALSIKMLTGKPIKYLGVGEKTDALEVFHPDRIASRILGMGDIVSLVEEVEQKIDKTKAEKLAKKIKKQKRFDLGDFKDQIQQMNKMGGVMGMLGKIPGLNQIPQALREQVDDKNFARIVAIINSMTPKEKKRPEIINGSRKRRIAQGSGTQPQDVNKLLKQFNQMQKMMKKFSKKGNMMRMMQQLQNQGGLPPGFM
ncbi:MAG: signal recognition particle protein [Pseudomonadota bacterium]